MHSSARAHFTAALPAAPAAPVVVAVAAVAVAVPLPVAVAVAVAVTVAVAAWECPPDSSSWPPNHQAATPPSTASAPTMTTRPPLPTTREEGDAVVTTSREVGPGAVMEGGGAEASVGDGLACPPARGSETAQRARACRSSAHEAYRAERSLAQARARITSIMAISSSPSARSCARERSDGKGTWMCCRATS